jgi:phospholipid/cholesterol/gamma-HCH transport system substrate-binding protein
MPRKGAKTLRVGILVVAAVAVLVTGILMIGGQNQLFTRKNEYHILFNNVSGLNAGNPVQLNGVDVGRVESVVLPEEPGKNDIRVVISVERRYAERVRQDSQASIKTLGLLGDKYIELTSGSLDAPPIPDGGRIETAPTTSIDALLAGGENLMDNVIAISFSLRNILTRMERGEGILGRLTVDTPEAQSIIDSVHGTVEAMEAIATKIDTGDGPLPRLINDVELADRVESSLTRLESILAKADEGEGALPKLLNDPATAARVDQTLAELEDAAQGLSSFIEEVETSEGLLQRMLTDEEYGREVSERLREVIDRVDRVSAEITEGEGTLARLIEDPQIYQSVKDILVGIDESRILRWLIRNRQKKGIETRYEEGVEAGTVPPIPPESDFPPGPREDREEAPPIEDGAPPPAPNEEEEDAPPATADGDAVGAPR